MAVSKDKKVQKSNDFNEANFEDFSLSTYRVILILISDLKKHDNQGNQLQLPVVSRECSLLAKEYADTFHLEGNTAYEILKLATDKLINTTYSIKTIRGTLKMNICSSAHYVEKEGRIDIRFTEEIMPHLAQLTENFTMYSLREISHFTSMYTTKLWEILMQFKTTGTITMSIDKLRFVLGCTTKLPQFAHLKQRAIDPAVNEINELYELNLSYSFEKVSRKVERINFQFTPLGSRKVYDPVKGKNRTQIQKPKRKLIKKVRELILTDEVNSAIDNGDGIKGAIKAAKEVRKNRLDYVQIQTGKIIQELMKAFEITEFEAKIMAIKKGLI